MNVLDKLRERAMGVYRTSDWIRPIKVEQAERLTGETRPGTLDKNEQYELDLTIRVQYWANTVQRAQCRKIAERHLANMLYRDVIAGLHQVESAIAEGEQLIALKLCSALINDLRGPEVDW